jgi:TolB-like protein/DNA-binding winged helix-turn-helix (wHTH) protein/Tfp pilus assembly protein PilF
MAGTRVVKGFRFGVFEIDLRACELRKYGIRIKLQGRPFQILTALVERPGETVTREELRRRLWPDDEYGEFDQSLNTAIKKLRQALGDSAGTPHYIETQARLGYRFVAPVEAIPEETAAPVAPLPPETPNVPVHSLRRYWWLAAAVLALVTIFSVWHFTIAAARAPQLHSGIASLAVLPLLNLSPGPEQDYFADGLTDALITNLAQIHALRVISRTSAMQYKGTRKLLPDIGRELQVDAVVEGTVQRDGPRVRVNVKLIRTSTEQSLWAESYERDLRDVLSLESEMAAAIARKVEIRLTPQESVHLSRSHPLDPDVFEAYLKGRYFWNLRSDQNLRKAIGYFEQALAKDPTYPLAYAGLADCYNMLSYYGSTKPSDSFPKAKAAAAKALALDDSLAEAHAALAYARLHFDWDWSGAEAEFQRALDLNPGYANAHHWYSHYLLAVGRTQEAMAATKQALTLDPLNLSINAHLAHEYLYMKRYDDAIVQVQKTLELNPGAERAHAWLGRAYEGKRMFEKAEAEFRQALQLAPGNSEFQAALAHVYAIAGKPALARQSLTELERNASDRYVSPYKLAVLHAALGAPESAFRWLDRARETRPEELIYIKTDPHLEALHSDRRFAQLLSRLGLPR